MTFQPFASRLAAWRRPAVLAMLVLLVACGEKSANTIALEPGKDAACALDGMVLADYPGPKAQIQYAEGEPEFFCDMTELFATVLAPEQKRPVAGMFVQDMGKADWAQPSGHWIDAKAAFYVVGSKKHGSMGPTFGSFSNVQDAEAFVKNEGGSIYRFEQITLDMVNLSASGASQDDKMH